MTNTISRHDLVDAVRRMKPEEQGEFIADVINSMSFDERKVAITLARQHRTLQQNFMRLCGWFIDEMAQCEYPDARNEASVEFAKEAVKLIRGFPFI